MLELIELNAVSYTLIALAASILFVPLFLSKDPAIHPFILQRQSNVAPVRKPKESAVYRSQATPTGYPLISGLQLEGEKAYQTRDGDIRDVWKLAKEKGNGKIITVRGSRKEEIDIETVDKWIHAIGAFVTAVQGAKRVAVYLPNDIENIVFSFASAFYGFTLIPLPCPADPEELKVIFRKTSPDFLVASAGTLPLEEIGKVHSLKHVMLVVEKASRHMDWSATSDMEITSSTFHGIIENPTGVSTPPTDLDLDGISLVYVYKDLMNHWETENFSQKVLIAGVAGQLAVLPKKEALTPADVFLPVSGLWEPFTRIVTYAALASGSTLAINSVAGPSTDLSTACAKVSPTVVVASPNTLLETLFQTQGSMLELWHTWIHWFQLRTLSQGQIPHGNWLTRINDYARPKLGDPQRLRIVFTAENGGVKDSAPLNSPDLADLRAMLGANIIYGLTSPRVAGAIAQQNIYDYRIDHPLIKPNRIKKIARKCAHFGPPMPNVEVKLVDVDKYKADDVPEPRGQIAVAGPSVIGGQAEIGVVGKWRKDGCLAYVLDGLRPNEDKE
ncbi:hypothetical protein BJ508DRAFT_410579 [Ascobolus immersus RN42]|uniref:AMP-dependent synthetase/ligase domain-containing protein n=1 Tax=Ascobolus immersus RN42 TaxID=1160509 RepID=A0A3N4IRZ9_ASCIM|nr:hypothetical protein BJ508DRAFT_410579 [Ascobolus immersus RN42]